MPDGVKVKMQLWDPAGVERFGTHALSLSYFRNVSGLVLTYDITNRESFQNLQQKWIPLVEKKCHDNIPKILVATKSDLED